MAMAFALLAGAGLLVKNLILLRSRDAGIRTERIVAFDVALSGPRYRDPDPRVAFYKTLYERLSHAPGVERLGMVSHLPMFNFGMNSYFQIDGTTPWGPNEAPLVEYRWIHGDYLQTMGIRLVNGRPLDERDRRGATTVLINESMARKFWPGADPDRQAIREGRRSIQVVRSGRRAQRRAIVRPDAERAVRVLPDDRGVAILQHDRRGADPQRRSHDHRSDRAPDRGVDRSDAADQPGADDGVGRERIGGTAAPDVRADDPFGVLAGALAIVGVYGVMAYTVRRQRREFGIRLALGADEARVRNLVVARGLTLTMPA